MDIIVLLGNQSMCQDVLYNHYDGTSGVSVLVNQRSLVFTLVIFVYWQAGAVKLRQCSISAVFFGSNYGSVVKMLIWIRNQRNGWSC